MKLLLASGRVSLFLDEVDEFETRVEEAVDAVGEARLFGARETGGGCSSHTPVFLVNQRGVNGRMGKHAYLSQHMLVILWIDS